MYNNAMIIESFLKNLQVADEGFIKNIGMKKHVNDLSKKYKSYPSILDMATQESFDDKIDMKNGIVNGYHIAIHKSISIEDTKLHKRDFDSIRQAVPTIFKKVCQSEVDSYNDSNGKNGPWEWTEAKDTEYQKRHLSDIANKVKLTTIFFDRIENGVLYAEMWFSDGGLYFDHDLVAEIECVNGKTKLIRHAIF